MSGLLSPYKQQASRRASVTRTAVAGWHLPPHLLVRLFAQCTIALEQARDAMETPHGPI